MSFDRGRRGERGGRGRDKRDGFGDEGGSSFGGGGFGGGGGGRLQASIYHTWNITDTLLIRQGLPELDLLNGSATGNNGGSPRHQVQFNGGYTRDGIGSRITLNWREGTSVNGGSRGGQALDFGSLTTVGARLFVDLGQQPGLVRDHPWFRGSRVSLNVDNLFNARQRVTDAQGEVPFSYQPGYVDPLGRVVRISFRKLFF